MFEAGAEMRGASGAMFSRFSLRRWLRHRGGTPVLPLQALHLHRPSIPGTNQLQAVGHKIPGRLRSTVCQPPSRRQLLKAFIGTSCGTSSANPLPHGFHGVITALVMAPLACCRRAEASTWRWHHPGNIWSTPPSWRRTHTR